MYHSSHGLSNKKELVDCVKSLYAMGLTTSVSGNQSIRSGDMMWITPSRMARYKIRPADLVKVDLKTSKVAGKIKPSIKLDMHSSVYNARPDLKAIVTTHSPFTINASISA